MDNYEYIDDVSRFTLITPVYKIKIDNNIITTELRDSSQRISSNPSDSFFEDFQINFERSPETKKLCDIIDNIIKDRYLSTNNIQVVGNKWAHIQRPLESCHPHTHKPASISFVYYVKVPEGAGDLLFVLDENVLSIPIPPEEGKLIIFPSWVKHSVNKNLSNDLRISISGNYNLIPLNEK